MLDFFISSAWAQDAGAPAQSPFSLFLPMIILFVAFYFLLIRPQQKKQKAHQAMVEALAVGDEVITSGGIVGKVASISDQFVVLTVAPDVDLKVSRPTVGAVLPKGTIDAA